MVSVLALAPFFSTQRHTNVSFQCGATKVADEEKRDAYSHVAKAEKQVLAANNKLTTS